jgi:hypothetical protein
VKQKQITGSFMSHMIKAFDSSLNENGNQQEAIEFIGLVAKS